MNQLDTFIPLLPNLSLAGVMNLHLVYSQGWPKFGIPIHLLKRDCVYEYMLLMFVPLAFEAECERLLNELHIKLP